MIKLVIRTVVVLVAVSTSGCFLPIGRSENAKDPSYSTSPRGKNDNLDVNRGCGGCS